MLVWDIETNGIRFGDPDWLDSAHTVHCLCIVDMHSDAVYRYRAGSGDIEEGVKMLADAEVIAGQNIARFDIPVLRRLYGLQPTGKVVDTKVLSEMVYGSALKSMDFERGARRQTFGEEWIPKNLYGSHSLAAWGARLGFPKDDYAKRCKDAGIDPWAAWSQEMEDYCVQDVRVTARLLEVFAKKGVLDTYAVEMEGKVAAILARQEARGFTFDEKGAVALWGELRQRMADLTVELQQRIPPFYVANGQIVSPKRTMCRRREAHGYTEDVTQGAEYQKVQQVDFNPQSRTHIARHLMSLGWKPKQLTPTGQPMVDETILKSLPWDICPLLAEYLMLAKRTGQIAGGENAWLKLVKHGRIHGKVMQNGARTGRMSHYAPNLAQVPRVGNPYGKECRALFTARDGYMLVGCDADGLELRMLAHYMALYDDGAFAHSVVEGKREDGTDAHTRNQHAIGLYSRDSAKTWLYARMYGAGPEKLGAIVWEDMPVAQRPRRSSRALKQLGNQSMERMASGIPALDALLKKVQTHARVHGVLPGLDGRSIPDATEHTALNTLLQGNGAIVMKAALVLLDDTLHARGLDPGQDYEFVANVHDEWQIETRPERAEEVGKLAADSIRLAGERLNLRCPLAGSYKVGKTWADTH